jgi:hypothetical protein
VPRLGPSAPSASDPTWAPLCSPFTIERECSTRIDRVAAPGSVTIERTTVNVYRLALRSQFRAPASNSRTSISASRWRATPYADTLREPRLRVGPARGHDRPFSPPRTGRMPRGRRTHGAVHDQIGRLAGSEWLFASLIWSIAVGRNWSVWRLDASNQRFAEPVALSSPRRIPTPSARQRRVGPDPGVRRLGSRVPLDRYGSDAKGFPDCPTWLRFVGYRPKGGVGSATSPFASSSPRSKCRKKSSSAGSNGAS